MLAPLFSFTNVRLAGLDPTQFALRCIFVLAIDEGLIAVRMVGDVSVGAAVFADLYESLQWTKHVLFYPDTGMSHSTRAIHRPGFKEPTFG